MNGRTVNDEALGDERARPLTVHLTARDLQPPDLDDVAWSGGPAHGESIRQALEASWAGEAEVVVIEASNGQLVALGAVSFRHGRWANLWMLSVDEAWQSLGIGGFLVEELESRARRRGLTEARLSVEHDNPRARALYERLGYRALGSSIVETWPIEGGRTWVTVCTQLAKQLG